VSPALPRGPLLLVLLGFAILSIAYSIVSPPFENPDELSHCEYAGFLSEHRRLPVLGSDCVRLAFHPPLYPALLAPVARLTGASTEAIMAGREVNPAYASSKVILVHGYPDEAFPYAGAVRFVHLARLLTILPALLVIVYTGRIAARVLDDRAATTLAMLAVATVPQFEYLAGSVNHDALAAAFAAALLYQCVRLCELPSAGVAGAAGVALGLGLLTKTSLLALAPLPALALAFRVRRTPTRSLLLYATIVYGLASATAGWWFLRNVHQYGNPLPLVQLHQTTWVGRHLVRTSPFAWAELGATLAQLFESFWFLAGLMNIAARPWMYLGWIVASSVATVGAIAMLRRPAGRLLVIGLLSSIAAVLYYTLHVYSSQGRYLFIALPAFGVALARGLLQLAPVRRRRSVFSLSAVLLTGLAVGCLVRSFAPVYGALEPKARSTLVDTAQLYCGHRYLQPFTARGGSLRGIRLRGRRFGADDAFAVELGLHRAASGEGLRTSSIGSAMLTRTRRTLVFSFPPIPTSPGDRYYVSLQSPDATPLARAGFTYRRAGDEDGLLVDGRPIGGNLVMSEILESARSRRADGR
jgi:Dolichyl-phosphate-mannose-protein mannosyltransferase